ncbi:bifunctional DNA primase/polymerase [Streptomyces sp. NPDC058086]|uniref:bifunctional DNA primase/polymerase n=1 Tax=Streptomyces sp. NPDC058086 TaxID=3346334 RepID=UPI0036E427F3
MPSELGSSRSDPAPCAATDGTSAAQVGLRTALWCAAQGWPVHQLAPGRKTPAARCRRCQQRRHRLSDCPCIAAGRWCHGLHAATTDVIRIRNWWTAQPRFGVGVVCGPAGLIVIDVDAHAAALPARDRLLPGVSVPESVSLAGLRQGFHSLALLAALHGAKGPAADSTTLRVRTPSGGLHIWYATTPELGRRSSSGSGLRQTLAWQVDVRAHGSYLFAPGTKTAARADRAARRPAALPMWLAAQLTRTGHRLSTAPPRQASVPWRGRQVVGDPP